MSVNLSFIGGAGWQFFDDNGKPLSGGKIYTYAAGTTTPQATYTAWDGLTANTNPIVLDSAGRTPSQIWSTEGVLYKYVVKTSADVLIRAWDNIGGSVVASDLAALLAASSGSDLVGYLPAGTGAVATTVQDKLRESISVKDFGAVGDGVIDDTAAVQAAINATANNSILEFVSGESYLVFELTFPDGIWWRGNGATILYDPATTGVSWMTAIGSAQSGRVEGLVFDYQTSSVGYHILSLGNNARDWMFLDCTFQNMNNRPALRTDYITSVAGDGNITVRGCKFLNGTGAGAIAFYSRLPNMGIENITVDDCDILDCGSSMLFIAMTDDTDDEGAGRYGSFKNTRITNVRFRGNGTGPFGAIPTELWGHDNLVVSNCQLDTATRGIGFTWSRGVTISNNVIRNQTSYAHEVGANKDVVISGESVVDCASFLLGTAILVNAPDENYLITGNSYVGTGRTVYNSGQYGIAFTTNYTVGLVRKNIVISNNLFRDLEYLRAIVRCAYTDGVTISDNSYLINTVYGTIPFVFLFDCRKNLVQNNSIILNADYTSSNPQYDNFPSVIQFIPTGTAVPIDDTVIKGNSLISNATTMSGNGIIGIGSSSGAGNCGRLSISDNVFQGLWAVFAGGKSEWLRNDVSNAVLTGAYPYGGSAGTTYSDTRQTYQSASVPTTGTFRQGYYIYNSSSTVGQPKGWFCTVAGTIETALVGITGSITTGTKTLVVNDASGLRAGQYITIAGVAGVKWIASIVGTTVTISSNANATVAAAAIAWSPWTLVSEGNL